MKKFKKILSVAAVSALTLTVGAFALTGCGGKDYAFEAEEALLEEPEGFVPNPQFGLNAMDVEEKNDGEVTCVGYFSTKGMTITWKVNASEDCEVVLKILGSSTKFKEVTKADGSKIEYAPPLYQPNLEIGEMVKGGLDELAAENCGVALKINGEEATMSGTLPGIEMTIEYENFMSMAAFYGLYKGGEFKANVKLKKGENTIVLESVSGGFNVDKLVVNSPVEVTCEKIDNSDRTQQMN